MRLLSLLLTLMILFSCSVMANGPQLQVITLQGRLSLKKNRSVPWSENDFLLDVRKKIKAPISYNNISSYDTFYLTFEDGSYVKLPVKVVLPPKDNLKIIRKEYKHTLHGVSKVFRQKQYPVNFDEYVNCFVQIRMIAATFETMILPRKVIRVLKMKQVPWPEDYLKKIRAQKKVTENE